MGCQIKDANHHSVTSLAQNLMSQILRPPTLTAHLDTLASTGVLRSLYMMPYTQ